MSEYLVVTGMSGAGRSTAGATLEDLGWFVIDNMPSALIAKVSELVDGTGSEMERVAFVVGRGGGDLDDVLPAVDALEAGRNRVRILFLDAADDVLIRRFEGTRRRHPQAARGVVDSIADERLLLSGLRDRADLVIDTGELNTNQLRTRLMEVFGGEEPGSTMRTSIVSFGFKHGVPARRGPDVRLPVPAQPVLGRVACASHSGLESEVREFVLDRPETTEFLDKLDDLLAMLIPAYIREGKSYLTVAMGCTGGRHRSVVLAEELSRRLDDHGHAHHRLPPGRRPVSRAPGHRGRPRSWPSAAATAWPPPCGPSAATPTEVTAIVSVADDGGSSGRLRELLADHPARGPAQVPGGPGRAGLAAGRRPSSTGSARRSWPATRWGT